MNILDVAILIVAALAAFAGWEMGFVARSLSWLGLAVGIFLGVKFAYAAVRSVPQATPGQRLIVVVAIIGAAALAAQAIGLLAGSKVSKFAAIGPARIADKAMGATLGVFSVAVLVWVLTPSLVNGAIAGQARNSSIVQAIGTIAPPQPSALRNFEQLVRNGDFPQVFNSIGASPNAGPPPVTSGVPGEVTARAEGSTVKVTGVACNLILDGSGFTTLAPDLVATNAHVVAGEKSTFVLTPNGQKLKATVVAFDEKRDVALLEVPGLRAGNPSEVPLGLATPQIGSDAVDIGHPGGIDQIVISPVRVTQQVDALGRDLYNQVDTSRNVYVLSADIQQGDPGSPIVNAAGQAVGMVFALAPDQPNTGYALGVNEIQAVYGSGNLAPVSTGPCIG